MESTGTSFSMNFSKSSDDVYVSNTLAETMDPLFLSIITMCNPLWEMFDEQYGKTTGVPLMYITA